jgi:hypothetical protein
VGNQTEIMQRVLQVHCLNTQNEFLGVFFNVCACVYIGHLKVKSGLGFNTICMTIYMCEVTIQYSTVRTKCKNCVLTVEEFHIMHLYH